MALYEKLRGVYQTTVTTGMYNPPQGWLMNRSGGITASAVIAIIGSALSILFGAFVVVIGMAMRTRPIPVAAGPPVAIGAVLIVEAVLFFGFGAWGIMSAVGLLRLRNWARISILIYAGLLAAF